MSGLSSVQIEGYLIVALFGLFLLRRTYAMTRGARVTAVRLTVLPVFYVGLYVAELAGTWFAAAGSGRAELSNLALVADAAMLVAGSLIAFRITSGHVELYRPSPGGAWYYRLRPLLPVLYIVFFLVRIALETVISGLSPFSVPTPATFDSLSLWALYVLFAVDALWGLTTGFLVGRSAAVYGAWQRAQHEANVSKPLPGG